MALACIPKYLIRLQFRRKSTNQVAVVDGGGVPGPSKETGDYYVDDAAVAKYNWNEIERVTLNFSRVIGSGGFSTVYLADLPGAALAAIKINCSSNHLNSLFKQELDILLHLRHDNIVKLLGYSGDQEGALVLEYVPNGSLQDKLHGEINGLVSWRRRIVIAFQLAQALEYLHEKCTLPIVHGDIKASNILLDSQFNCKLCDFGSAKMGFSSTVLSPSRSRTRKHVMMGSLGYTDPHYLRTGIASKKNDIYSYGVIVLELVTGMAAFSEERGQPLTSTMGPILIERDEPKMVAEMVDPRLAGDFDINEARVMFSISALCLRQAPTLRPSATQILHNMKANIPSIFLCSSVKD